MKRQPRKQLLIDTAYRLFNRFGYHATGIDRIMAESGVSKTTLYKYYRTKDELILAVLQQRHRQLETRLQEQMEEAGDDPQPALAVFDVLDEWFHSSSFHGCNFINASAEYTQPGDSIHDFVRQHKERVRELIELHLRIPQRKTRRRLADEIALLVDGAIVAAHTRGDKAAAGTARKMAERLVALALE